MACVLLRKAVEFFGLHPKTLRKYADEGQIKSIRTPNGQRLFDVGGMGGDSASTATICYCRVSSAKQGDDLTR
ncbi:MerR family DNA-binding transcriptional regulator [Kamptonema formosum]|uniref:MerR family DNA-binding transcriptional regulator n=1 Tax=Kamptonema formosum TaxID=331992 RepID=UPI001E30EBFC|nr:MerR family DNA-binding transcriptional regulator [Oscillatoria sp. PCC 10802]